MALHQPFLRPNQVLNRVIPCRLLLKNPMAGLAEEIAEAEENA